MQRSIKGGAASLDKESLNLLAGCLLAPASEVLDAIIEFSHDSQEFIFAQSVPIRVIFKGSQDLFIEGIAKGLINRVEKM